jgi:putative heme-binding domain-containing protein
MRFVIWGFFVLQALLAPQGHDTTPADIEAGSRYYGNYCAGCHGADGKTMQGANLSRGTFRRATTDDELMRIIINGIPGTAMPPAAFKTEQAAQIVAFLRAFPASRASSTVSGDAAKGKQIFEAKGGCFECHRVNGRGSRVGPDLSDVGELRRAAEIEQSLVDPGAVILPQNRILTVATRDGKSIRGRLLNQDTQAIQILSDGEVPMSIERERIRTVVEDRASMPSYKEKLAPQELADLVSYLASLKGIR